MMTATKLFEVRDAGTFIPALAVRLAPGERTLRGLDDYTPATEHYLLCRAGYGEDQALVLLARLEGGEAQYDPYAWRGNRTMQVAHAWIAEHWAELRSGAVVDVEFILGITTQPKLSERAMSPLET